MVEKRSRRPAFGALLRELRVAAGLTQELLADRARISVQAVSALERGARGAPRADTLALLAEALALDGEALAEFEAAARASVKAKVRTEQPLLGSATVVAERSHVPRFTTLFVGREREERELEAAIAPGLCVTLWGTGGAGKTRLAVETSNAIGSRFERTIFVALASTIGDAAVEDTVAAALGVTRQRGQDLFPEIVAALGASRSLLVLDNCEHVIGGAARFADRLLAALPDVAVVCTSREPLRIGGERVFAIGPLAAEDALRLFIDRAAAASPANAFSGAELRSIETISRRLDGIPLALELAAACTRALDVGEIARGLDERFQLLTRGSRAVDERHLTLEATIRWSYELLEESERLVFVRAGIVNGAFSLEDLSAIAVDGACDRATVVSALAALVDKSLAGIESDAIDGMRRYRLLESTRAFAQKISECAGAQQRFGRYLLDRVVLANQTLQNGVSSRTSGLERYLDFDNARGYLDWAIEKANDVVAGTELAGEMHMLWDLHGLQVEGLRRIEAGLARLPESAAIRRTAMIATQAVARLLQRLAFFAESTEWARKAHEIALSVGDRRHVAASAGAMAFGYYTSGDYDDALACANEAATLFEELGDASAAAFAYSTAALVTFKIHRDERGLEALRHAVEMQRALRKPSRMASTTLLLAEAEFECGLVDRAIETVRQAIAGLRQTSSKLELSIALMNLSSYLARAGRVGELEDAAREGLQIGRSGSYTRIIVLSVQACALVAALRGRALRNAAELLGYVSQRYGTIGEIGFTETSAHDGLRTLLGERLATAELAAAIEAGHSLDSQGALEAALMCVETGNVFS